MFPIRKTRARCFSNFAVCVSKMDTRHLWEGHHGEEHPLISEIEQRQISRKNGEAIL